ncbi:GNAT family N-acetyltransferase [Halobacteriales archaeon Cl-PHB]
MVEVREATAADETAVRNVVDGANLALDDGLTHDGVYVAEADGRDVVVGALVCDGETVQAIAVRPRRRDQGIGTALVEAAMADRDRLVAEFDPRVRAFWDSLGFAIDAAGDGSRLRGVCVVEEYRGGASSQAP